MVKNSPANAEDAGLVPESGRSHGEGNGNPLHYSCLGNPMDRGVPCAIVCNVAKRQTRLTEQQQHRWGLHCLLAVRKPVNILRLNLFVIYR